MMFESRQCQPSDSTAYMDMVNMVVSEWTMLHRKGSIVLHLDGAGVKKIEYIYSQIISY